MPLLQEIASRGTRYPTSPSLRASLPSSCYQTRVASSIPDRRTPRSTDDIITSHQASITKPEPQPWIRPGSLKDTLEQHRKANRSGEAIDGVRSPSIQALPKHKRKHSDNVTPSHDELQKLWRRQGFRRPPTAYKVPRLPASEPALGDNELSQIWKPSSKLPIGLRLPWLKELARDVDTSAEVPAIRRLDDEVRAFQIYLNPTRDEQVAAHRVISDVQETVAEIFAEQHIDAKLLGSHATGLANPLSDFDFNLVSRGKHQVTREDSSSMLKAFRQGLVQRWHSPTARASLRPMGFIRSSKVQVVDCLHMQSGIMVQVQATNQDTANLSTQVVKVLLAEFPNLRPLFSVLKQMLNMRGWTKGYSGGLTTYPLLNMIVASLRLGNTAADRNAVGAQLLEFLDFYSEINLHTTAILHHPTPTLDNDLGVTIESGASEINITDYDPFMVQPVLSQIKRRSVERVSLMCLQDPANPANNLGRHVFLMSRIQAFFIVLREEFRNSMSVWDDMHRRGVSMGMHGKPLLGFGLEGDYSIFEEARCTVSYKRTDFRRRR